MRILLIWAIGLAAAGICIMLYGIGLISAHPVEALPKWVKLALVIIASLFIVIYGMLMVRIILRVTQVNMSIMVHEGGIWL